MWTTATQVKKIPKIELLKKGQVKDGGESVEMEYKREQYAGARERDWVPTMLKYRVVLEATGLLRQLPCLLCSRQ